MKIVYHEDMLVKINREIERAQKAGKYIKEIILTPEEWGRLCLEVSYFYPSWCWRGGPESPGEIYRGVQLVVER